MAVKIYSDVTKQFYKDEASALAAEKKVTSERDAKTARRKDMAREVEQKYKLYTEANKNYSAARKAYYDSLENFCKEFGPYHISIDGQKIDDILKRFFEY